MLPLEKTPVGVQAFVIYPLGHGHITNDDKILFFTYFDAWHYFKV